MGGGCLRGASKWHKFFYAHLFLYFLLFSPFLSCVLFDSPSDSLFIILRFSFFIFWCFYFFDIFDWPSDPPWAWLWGLSLFGLAQNARARGFLINFPARKSFSTTFAFSWHLTAWRLFNSMSTVSPPSTVLMPHFVACDGREKEEEEEEEITRFCVIPFIRVINFYCQPLRFIMRLSLRRGVAQLVYNVCNIKLFEKRPRNALDRFSMVFCCLPVAPI